MAGGGVTASDHAVDWPVPHINCISPAQAGEFFRRFVMDRALVSFELLEGRKLLSATLENGVLTVTGTRHGDKMEISLDHEDPTKLNVQVNDETSSFSLADITGGVVMNGGNGSDKMAVNEVDGALS